MSEQTTEVVDEENVNLNPEPEPQPEPTGEELKEELKLYQKDMWKYKKRVQEGEKVRQELEGKLKVYEIEQLESKQEYKSLYEQEKKLKEDAVGDLEKEKYRTMDEKKFNSIWKAAKSKGIHDDAFDDLYGAPRDEVFIEEDDRGIRRVVGAEQYIESMFEKKRHWFKTGKAPNVDPTLPDGVVPKLKVLSSQEILKLEKTDKPAYLREMKKLRGR